MRGPQGEACSSQLWQVGQGALSAIPDCCIAEPRPVCMEHSAAESSGMTQKHHAAQQDVPMPSRGQGAGLPQHLGSSLALEDGHAIAEQLYSRSHMPLSPPADQLPATASTCDQPDADQQDMSIKAPDAQLCGGTTRGEECKRPQASQKSSGPTGAHSPNGLRQACKISKLSPHAMPAPSSSCRAAGITLGSSGSPREQHLNGGALAASPKMSSPATKGMVPAQDGARLDTVAPLLHRLTQHDQQLAMDHGERSTGHPACRTAL